MNTQIDIAEVYRTEKQRWMKTEAPRRGFREIVAASVPYWIILVAVCLYLLSAPHTAAIFSMITPGFGVVAPLAVEFGLLFTSFSRKLAASAQAKTEWAIFVLEGLFFMTAVLVNGAGAFTNVVMAIHLDTLSFDEIWARFRVLPATSQAGLLMAVMSAFIIPVGAMVAGGAFAKLVLDRSASTDHRETRWQEVEVTVIYRAVYTRYTMLNVPAAEARKLAEDAVRGYFEKKGRGALTGGGRQTQLSAGVSESPIQVSNWPMSTVSVDTEVDRPGTSKRPRQKRDSNARGKVMDYLTAHPEAVNLSARKLGEVTGVSHQTANEVKQDYVGLQSVDNERGEVQQ